MVAMTSSGSVKAGRRDTPSGPPSTSTPGKLVLRRLLGPVLLRRQRGLWGLGGTCGDSWGT
jgi:hypothetical protein